MGAPPVCRASCPTLHHLKLPARLPPPLQALVELPYVTLQAALYSVVTFFMIEFVATAARFFWYFFFTWLW